MNSDRQARATEILRQSSTRPEEERHGFAVAACGEDSELQAMVETMLTQVRSSGLDSLKETEVVLPPAQSTSDPGKPVSDGFSAMSTSTVRKRVESGDMTGHRIGPYELIRRIGKGGMGTVYVARRVDQEFRKLVAIKFVKPGMETDEIIQRFRQERQVLAGLDHPNIARLLDGGSDRGIPYLVMEYVEGTPIDEYMRNHRLTVVERLRLFCIVCSAVQYAHQSLVVHRDIKPTNIMVTADGTPKLLDFGIAKVLSPEFAESRAMTMATERPMTPDFASPEQVRGEPVTTSSDVYALGVLLYEVLTGGAHPLHYAYKKLGFQRAVLEAEPERPSSAVARLNADAPDIPEGSPDKLRNRLKGDLDAILLMALRKEPQRRYASVQHFADDIHRYLQSAPVRAQKDTVGYRTRKFVRRNTAGVLAGTAVLIALIASSIISFSFYRVANRERQNAERRFSDVRQLANYVLSEFDDAIKRGPTAARAALIEKATEYLNRLEQDRGRDPSLDRELAEGYIKVGALQGNLYGPNLGNRAAAKAAYEHALRIVDTSTANDPKLMTRIRAQLADLLAQTGTFRDAIEPYEKCRDVLRNYPDDPDAAKLLLRVLSKLGFAHEQLAANDQAIRDWDEYSNVAQRLYNENPSSTEYLEFYALGGLHGGKLRADAGEAHGLPQMERALRTFERLLTATPTSLTAQRNVVTATGLIGDSLKDANRFKEAEQSYRRALEVTEALAKADPRNEQYERDLYTYHARLADAAAGAGDMTEARKHTKAALDILSPIVDRGQMPEMWQYAWTLLTTPFADLRNPALAKPYAEKVVELSKGQNPSALDLLARAYAGTRDFAKAVETETLALSLLAPGSKDSALRKEFEQNLAAFKDRKAMPQQR